MLRDVMWSACEGSGLGHLRLRGRTRVRVAFTVVATLALQATTAGYVAPLLGLLGEQDKA